MVRRAPGERSNSAGRLLAVYAAASLVPIVLLGVVLVGAFRHEARARGLSEARTEAALLASTSIGPQLNGRPLSLGLTPTTKAALARITASALADGDILRLRLRDLQGRVVFSNDGSGFGEEIEDEALEAAHGEQVAHLKRFNSDVDDAGPAGALAVEAYIPLEAGPSSEQVGVLEVYLPYAPIAAEISSGLHRLTWQASVGLALLYLVLAAVSASITRRLRRESRRNRFLARHDPLTGLPNRVAFRARAGDVVEDAIARGRRSAVAVFDLDRFKEVNDTLGHMNGDDLLLELSRRLEEHAVDGVVVARLGGDEFGVVLPDVADTMTAADALWTVRGLLEGDVEILGLPLSVQASIGFTIAPDDGTDIDELIQRADVAMYHAKSAHLGVARYDRAHDHYDAAKLALVTQLRQAIERDELVLHFQPKVTTGTGDVSAVEALVRWNHPEKGLVPPDDFLPIAEQTDLIDPLTSWVLDTALAQLRTWGSDASDLAVAVNISARSLIRSDFADEVLAALHGAGIAPHRLLLEITETALVADPKRAAAILAQLYREGVRVSIDDFGQGQTSLGYLSHLALFELKIDKSFVLGRADPTNAAIISSVIQLGHNLGLQVVAEGVETSETLEWLRAAGCDIAQGFLFARPMPAEQMSGWLAQRRGSAAPMPAHAGWPSTAGTG